MAPSKQNTYRQREGEEGRRVAGGEREPVVHRHAVRQGQLDIRPMLREPCKRSGGYQDMLDELCGERRESLACGRKQSVSETAEKEDGSA